MRTNLHIETTPDNLFVVYNYDKVVKAFKSQKDAFEYCKNFQEYQEKMIQAQAQAQMAQAQALSQAEIERFRIQSKLLSIQRLREERKQKLKNIFKDEDTQ